jgi:hypothetical protein
MAEIMAAKEGADKLLSEEAHDLQAWTEGAQLKISEILAVKENLETLLAVEKEVAPNRQDEIEQLKRGLVDPSQKSPQGMGIMSNSVHDTAGSADGSNDAEAFVGSGEGNVPVAGGEKCSDCRLSTTTAASEGRRVESSSSISHR